MSMHRDRVIGVRALKIDLAQNWHEVVNNWNVGSNNWLKRCTSVGGGGREQRGRGKKRENETISGVME